MSFAAPGVPDSVPVHIPVDHAGVSGDLVVPDEATGLVIFAHGSGSSRHSPRNRAVAAVLQRAGLGTLLLDLLTPDEERLDSTGQYRFDIALLATRLGRAIDWALRDPATSALSIGLFGASTGAAAALVAAAEHGGHVRAVVSRGGRPDLAGASLPLVTAPTLLIVGGRDDLVIDLNRRAARQLRCPVELQIVPGATHLFEEPGTLDQVSVLAARWLKHYLTPVQPF